MTFDFILLDIKNKPDYFSTYGPVIIAAIAVGVQIYWNGRTLKQSRLISEQQLAALRSQLASDNENAFKYSSIQLATKMDEDFDDLEEQRVKIGAFLKESNLLDGGLVQNYNHIRDELSAVLDIFDTVGYFVKNNYLKAEVAHEYFHYWFSHYYVFFVNYDVRKLSGEDQVIWNNLQGLCRKLDIVETAQRHGLQPPEIEKKSWKNSLKKKPAYLTHKHN